MIEKIITKQMKKGLKAVVKTVALLLNLGITLPGILGGDLSEVF